MAVTAALLVWALAVAVRDERSRRIDNWLLAVPLAAESVSWWWRGESLLGHGFKESALGMLLAGAVFLPGYLVKAFGLGRVSSGGGDVKFAAVCGWIAGLHASFVMMLVTAGTLGVFSGVTYLRRARTADRSTRLPAGPSIAIGFAVTLLLLTLNRS
jgi:Flp pilus assembly protein protease CpaA